jgi:phenylacetate-coenzyme A ligase PaaK-like adenylate-forming protein
LGMFWEQCIETVPQAELRALQEQRLQETLLRAMKSTYYRRMYPEPLPDGEEGELVLTTLDREAMPLIRYRTRDLTSIVPGACPCGRTHRRISRIKGRSDDMFIIKGVNVFPLQVETLLMSIPEVGRNYQIILENEGPMDAMTVRVEVQHEFFRGDIKGLKALQQRITAALKGELLFTPRVALVEPDSLPKSEGKAVRVVDRRRKE